MKTDIEIAADCIDRMLGTLTVTVNVKVKRFKMSMLRIRIGISLIKFGCMLSRINYKLEDSND